MVQAYADDQVVIITGKSLNNIERKWEKIWTAAEAWASKSGLKYNNKKTKGLLISNGRKKTRPPRLRTSNGATVKFGNVVKYLGVTFDNQLNFVRHIESVKDRVIDTARRLFLVTGRNWGKSPALLKMVWKQAVCPMVLYGSEVWGQKAGDTRISSMLSGIERPFLRSITKAYRTAPTLALNTIAGCPPLVMAKARYWGEATWGERRDNSK